MSDDQRRGGPARSYNYAGFIVVAAGVLATIGAFMQWYAPARALVFPDLSGVGLSGGVVLVATVGMAGLGLAIALVVVLRPRYLRPWLAQRCWQPSS